MGSSAGTRFAGNRNNKGKGGPKEGEGRKQVRAPRREELDFRREKGRQLLSRVRLSANKKGRRKFSPEERKGKESFSTTRGGTSRGERPIRGVPASWLKRRGKQPGGRLKDQ